MKDQTKVGVSKIKHQSRKRIMFVVTTPFAVNAFLASHLKILSKWFDVTLCVNVNAYPLQLDIANTVEVVHIQFERKIMPLLDLVSLVRLYLTIKRSRPLAIHSITPKAGLLAMLAGFVARVPHRWHTFTGQVWENKQSILRFILKGIDRLIVSLSTRIFADSISQCRFLSDEKVVSENQISILGPGSIAGVDTDKFFPDISVRHALRQELEVADEACIFLFVGRMVRDKGVIDLLNAFVKLAAESETQVGLWMVGPDEENLLPELKQMGETHQFSIRWIGSTHHPEKYMMAADVLVLPSYREGFGSVIIEAGSCSLPVIAYKINGVIDAIEEEVTGLLVEVGRIDLLTEKLRLLALDQKYRTALGTAAREHVINVFSVKAVSDAWLMHYQNCLLDPAN